MDCFLLGTGGMMPMPYRMLVSLAVRLNGSVYIFDAGEGTQIGLKKLRLGVSGMRVIALSHLHADHCLGIPGLLMLKAQMESPGPVTVLGPPGVERFLTDNRDILGYQINYPVDVVEWSADRSAPAYEDEMVKIYWHQLKHTRFCLGYRLEEHERPGKFYPDRALALGIPPGPAWGLLQKGESVRLEDGREILAGRVSGPPRRGRHLGYAVDTRPTKSLYNICRDVDMAFLEGMFLPEDSEHAEEKGHMTVSESASIARRAGAARAVLLHISPRYGNEDLDRLAVAARQKFEHVEMGRDLASYSIPLPD